MCSHDLLIFFWLLTFSFTFHHSIIAQDQLLRFITHHSLVCFFSFHVYNFASFYVCRPSSNPSLFHDLMRSLFVSTPYHLFQHPFCRLWLHEIIVGLTHPSIVPLFMSTTWIYSSTFIPFTVSHLVFILTPLFRIVRICDRYNDHYSLLMLSFSNVWHLIFHEKNFWWLYLSLVVIVCILIIISIVIFVFFICT